MMSYSSDEAIDNLSHNDSNVMLAGFVVAIEPPKMVGKTRKFNIQKLILSNNSTKRFTTILWGQAVIDQYQSLLTYGQNMLIRGAKTTPINERFWKAEDNLCKFEVNIGESSIIEGRGMHVEDSDLNLADAAEKDSLSVETAGPGFYKIHGYLASAFCVMQQNYGSFATSSITNGVSKLNIRVQSTKNIPETMVSGRRVTVHGKLEVNASTNILHLLIQTFDHIIADMEVGLQDEIFLLNGTKAAKRRTIDQVD